MEDDCRPLLSVDQLGESCSQPDPPDPVDVRGKRYVCHAPTHTHIHTAAAGTQAGW